MVDSIKKSSALVVVTFVRIRLIVASDGRSTRPRTGSLHATLRTLNHRKDLLTYHVVFNLLSAGYIFRSTNRAGEDRFEVFHVKQTSGPSGP